MEEEFPRLEPREYQKDFLADWYSPHKLFIGGRQSGKTELLISEFRRFQRHDFDCLIVCSRQSNSQRIVERYEDRFGETLNPDRNSIHSYHSVKDGMVRGYKFDVVLLDEFQQLAFEDFQREVVPIKPSFTRAFACRSDMHATHYLNDEPGFFDSVYTDN